MTIRNLAIGTASMALLAAAVCAAPALLAQTPPTEPIELESIRVIAPATIYRQEQQSGTAMPPSRVAERSALVKFDDLDLRLPGDQRVLDERIARTARELCNELAREVPKGSPGRAGCADQAIEESRAQVRQAVELHSLRK